MLKRRGEVGLLALEFGPEIMVQCTCISLGMKTKQALHMMEAAEHQCPSVTESESEATPTSKLTRQRLRPPTESGGKEFIHVCVHV